MPYTGVIGVKLYNILSQYIKNKSSKFSYRKKLIELFISKCYYNVLKNCVY